MSHHHDDHDDLDEHHHKLMEEAHFVGPPEEDPILEVFLCPFKTYHKDHAVAKEKPQDLRFLKDVIHHNEKDPSIAWFGLFTDLIFVAIIVKFADQFKYMYKYESENYYAADKDEFYMRIIGETLLFFFAFYTVWLELVCCNTRFCNIEGALDDILFLVYLIGIIVMAVQMSATRFLMEHKIGFISGLLVCFASLTCLHIQYHQVIPRAKHYAERRMVTYSITCVILFIALMVGLFTDSDSAAADWFCAFSVIVSCTISLGVQFISFRVDPRYEHYTLEYFEERFGILVMIVTGESILALLVGDKSSDFKYYYNSSQATNVYYTNVDGYYIYKDQGAFLQYGGYDNFEDYLGVFIAFLTMYIIKNIYFESRADEHEHALAEVSHPGSVVWVVMHLPLAFFLLGCGIGYKLLFTSIHYSTTPEGYRLILGICLCGAILSMLFIRAAHDRFIFPIQSMAIRIPTAVLIPLGALFFDNAIEFMLWCCGFVVLSWVYDLVIMESLEIKKPPKEEEEHFGHDKPRTAGNMFVAFAQFCGFVDKEYQGAFHGPKHEGHPLQLLTDVVCFRICDEPAPAPAEFPPEFIEEISTVHEHHGHGHEEHVNEAEAGADHGWFGEFTDLIFVAIVIKFADQMKYKQTTPYQESGELVNTDWRIARIYLESALFFGAFAICWLELTHMLNRFRNMPGIFDDIMYFFYMFGVIGMGIQMNHLEYLLDRREGFCAWYAFTLFCLVVLHAKFYQIDDAEDYCKTRIVTFSCALIMALVGGFLSEIACACLLVLSYSITLFISLNSFRVWRESEPNPHIQEEYIERFGLIIMITTGESILALILADFEQKFEFYAIVIIAFCTMFTFKLIYFESHSEEPKMHGLAEGNMPGAVMWSFMHLPAAYFLLGAGVGYKMLLPYADESDVDLVNRGTLGFSVAGIILCFIVIRAAHNKFKLPIASVFIRIPVAALAPAAAWYIKAPLSYVTWCFCIVLVSYSLDMLLIKQLRFEVDLDFMHKIHETKKAKGKRLAHAKKTHDTDIEMLEKAQFVHNQH